MLSAYTQIKESCSLANRHIYSIGGMICKHDCWRNPTGGDDCYVDKINIAQLLSYRIKIWLDVDNCCNVVYGVMV